MGSKASHVTTKRRENEHVGRKSSSQNKGEGALDKAKGKAKDLLK